MARPREFDEAQYWMRPSRDSGSVVTRRHLYAT